MNLNAVTLIVPVLDIVLVRPEYFTNEGSEMQYARTPGIALHYIDIQV